MTDRPNTSQKRTVRCPACGGPSVYAPENPHRPFCSATCKLHDLGAWASESFRLDAEESEQPPQLNPLHDD